MKRITLSTLALLCLVGAVYARDIEVKWSGPSGQGNMIFWAPSTGVTNLSMTTAGLVDVTVASGGVPVGVITLATGKIIVGNQGGVGLAVTVSGDGTIATNGVLTLTDNAVPASQIGPGIFASDVIFSNLAANVYASNITMTAGGAIEAQSITATADLLITPAGTEVHIDGGLAVGDTTAVGDNNLKVVGTSLLVGEVTLTANIDIDGGGITCPADLLITPAGTEVHVNGGVHVGGTDAVGDNNLKVDGTAAIVGVATFTAESVHNLGIDADYITVDAAAGIDTKTAGTLLVGAATANKIEVSITGVETEIQGTLDCQEVATFAAESVHELGIDADYITTDAAAGIDVKSAGALKVGVTTATSVDYGSVAATAHTFSSDGTGTAEVVLPAGSIDGTEILDDTVDSSEYAATSIDSEHLNQSDIVGVANPTKSDATTVTNRIGVMQFLRVDFTNVIETATDGSAEGESQIICTFPVGHILISGAHINATVTNSLGLAASTDDTYVTAIGTVAAADDATLTGTEADVIASTTHDTVSNTGSSFEWEAILTTATPATVHDGTSSAIDLYANFGIADASMGTGTNITFVLTGYVDVFYTWLGTN